MNIKPNKSEYDTLTTQGNAIPVYLDLTADCETPLGAYSKIRHEAPSFLFESIVGGERISRFSSARIRAKFIVYLRAKPQSRKKVVRPRPSLRQPIRSN